MAEYISFFTKDTLIIKPPKKTPLLLRTAVLMFAMACGVFICLICLRQLSAHTGVRFPSIQAITNITDGSTTKLTGVPLDQHYPIPKTLSRAECVHNPVRFFAVVSMQRSGSGWFESLLNDHVNVSSNGEIFSCFKRRKNISSILKCLDRVYNLDWSGSASKNTCTAAVGFKWMLNQADTLSKYKPIINTASLISDLNEMEATTAKALRYYNSTRHIVLYYEDLIKNSTASIRKTYLERVIFCSVAV